MNFKKYLLAGMMVALPVVTFSSSALAATKTFSYTARLSNNSKTAFKSMCGSNMIQGMITYDTNTSPLKERKWKNSTASYNSAEYSNIVTKYTMNIFNRQISGKRSQGVGSTLTKVSTIYPGSPPKNMSGDVRSKGVSKNTIDIKLQSERAGGMLAAACRKGFYVGSIGVKLKEKMYAWNRNLNIPTKLDTKSAYLDKKLSVTVMDGPVIKTIYFDITTMSIQ